MERKLELIRQLKIICLCVFMGTIFWLLNTVGALENDHIIMSVFIIKTGISALFISLSGICMSELQKIEDILLRRKAISHTHNDNPTEFDYTKFV